MPGTRFSIEVQAKLPENLKPLEQLANNLIYSWDRRVRRLFFRMDPAHWEQSDHNPKVFLRRISQARLHQLSGDESFLEEFHSVLSIHRSYRERTYKLHPLLAQRIDAKHDLIAYFCAEFGLHESLPIYSGGLGILAGDHLKGASDLGLPLIAVGLMYRQGYFTQCIDENGEQRAQFHPHNFADLPVAQARTDSGEEVKVTVPIADREITVRVWQADVGHIRLILLDTDVPENKAIDRAITYQLYGGDRTVRLAQEMVLGVGGVRAIRALGLTPSAWHMNEGHAAFLSIERCREAMANGLDFDAALELIAGSAVFTTHTPVAAGHDLFDSPMIDQHLRPFARDMGIPLERLLALGYSPNNQGQFNMTNLGIRCSRFHNGVSAIHGEVASRMEGYHWPQIPAEENPIGYVTNGIHVPTFLARDWALLLDMWHPEWRDRLTDDNFWIEVARSIPDQAFWDTRQRLKAEMLEYVCRLLRRQYRRNKLSEVQIQHLLRNIQPSTSQPLVLGFARRFATYKRATLLFRDPARLSRLLNDPNRPMVLLFAGKAHPQDKPGQELIRIINDYAEQPEFSGKVFFVENYDLALGRQLVAGVDVWINNPKYPLEACGTSGQKAGCNGVLNLSVLDGWWGESFNGENGWGIVPHSDEWGEEVRERREAIDLMDILEHEVVPTYFKSAETGYSIDWVRKSKAAMSSILPQYNTQRMLTDYVDKYYAPAIRHGRLLAENSGQPTRDLTLWKQRIKSAWAGVRLERSDNSATTLPAGGLLSMRAKAQLNGLKPEDLRIECVLGAENHEGEFIKQACYTLNPLETQGDSTLFALDLPLDDPGLYSYEIRAFPYHSLLAHPFEMGCLLWL